MSTQEVANRLTELCRAGNFEQAIKELYAPEIVSVEPEGMPNRIVKGLEAIAVKGANFQNSIEKVNSSSMSDPVVAANLFSCSMLMNVQFKGAPGPIDMDEICLYTVKDGKIVREEFFYTAPTQ